MMPLALAWYEGNAERDRLTWPAERLIHRFVNLIEDAAWQKCRVQKAVTGDR